MNRTWTDNDVKILNELYFDSNREDIVKLFPNRNWSAIRNKAISLGLKRKNLNGKSEIKNLLLDTPEAYYWIGFLMADGYINHERKLLVLTLSEKDSEQSKKFAKFIGSKIINIRKTKMNVVSQLDKEVVTDIIKKFDFRPRKTYNPPEDMVIKNNGLFIAFMIGYIDGDGCIAKDGRLQIECHISWKNCLNEWFERLWKISNCESLNLCLHIPKVSVKTRDGITTSLIKTRNNKFNYFLKQKCLELNIPYLRRKWNRVILKNISNKNSFETKKEILEYNKNGYNNTEISNLLHLSKSYIGKIVNCNVEANHVG